jgi:hypothetical protein
MSAFEEAIRAEVESLQDPNRQNGNYRLAASGTVGRVTLLLMEAVTAIVPPYFLIHGDPKDQTIKDGVRRIALHVAEPATQGDLVLAGYNHQTHHWFYPHMTLYADGTASFHHQTVANWTQHNQPDAN